MRRRDHHLLKKKRRERPTKVTSLSRSYMYFDERSRARFQSCYVAKAGTGRCSTYRLLKALRMNGLEQSCVVCLHVFLLLS